MTEEVEINQSGGILRITLNRPQARNAITGAMYDSMREHFSAAARDDAVHVVLLTAVGKAFCAGNDIRGFSLIRDIPIADRPGFRFMNVFARFPKPIVACVQGDAVGIGATLLLHCDLVYAVERANLVFPFLEIGLTPEFASTFLLPRLMGHPRAFELLSRTEPCPATRAVDLGLVNQIVADARIDAHALEAAHALARLPLPALITTKQLMKQPLDARLTETIAREMHELNQRLMDTATHAALGDGIKRQPG